MRRRFSSLAIVIVGALAVRAAYWPMFLGTSHSECGYEPSTSLADIGMHVPAMIVLVLAALDLLASFAPPSSVLPRAVAGRREVWWIPLASPARVLLESDVAITLRSVAWVMGFMLVTLAFAALGGGGPGSDLAFASHLLLALLVVLRLPPTSPYEAS
jgi:hypothetical protein